MGGRPFQRERLVREHCPTMSRSRALPLALLFSAYLAALVASAIVAVRVDLFGWDVDITKWTQRNLLQSSGWPREILFWMGLRGVAGVTFAALLALLWRRRERVVAVMSVVLIGLPDLFNIALREIIGRPRPTTDLVDVFNGGTQGSSYPSGHSLHVILFYGFLIYLLPRFLPSRRLRLALYILLVLYIMVTGLWLIYDGRHWFTDVMGGYLYGGFYLLALIVGTRRMEEAVRRPGGLPLPAWTPKLIRRPLQYLLSA